MNLQINIAQWLIYCNLLLTGCGNNRVQVNIPPTFTGYIYIVSAKDGVKNEKNLTVDQNGIVYLYDYCSGNNSIDFAIDGKLVEFSPVFSEQHFESAENNGEHFSVSYSTTLFPFKPRKDYSLAPASATELIKQGKLNIDKVEACE